MDDLSKTSERLRSSLADPQWSPLREQAILVAVKKEWARDRTGRRRWPALAAAAVLVLMTGSVLAMAARSFWFPKKVAGLQPAVTSPQVAPREVVLRDGSVARLMGDSSAVRVDRDDPTAVRLTVLSGAAHFEVTHNEQRSFLVLAGDVAVEVVGTVFNVERLGSEIRVSVERGHVRVEQSSRTAEISAGDSVSFASPGIAREPAEEISEPPSVATPAASSTESARGRWRTLARDGQYAAAYDAFKREGAVAALPDEPGALLLGADVARLSGHPAEAVAPLRKLLAHHRADPRAAAGAFTLGKVLMDDLGQAREAAQVFAQVGALDSHGSLSEDALAREIDAWSRAGEEQKVRDRAADYAARFPHGAHARMVRKAAGLE